jgi:hypothetical protein
MNTDSVPAGLEQVRADLAAWRGQRRKGERIPKEFWRRAARAVRQYGLNPVSHALRLDYYQLKRLAGRCEAQRHREASTGPVFVEVSAGSGGERVETETGLACVVELEKGNGARMRICVRDTVAVDWGKLKEAFLGA